jgi:hypothetical protein
MTASGDASKNTGTLYNYNGKIGCLNSGSGGDLGVALGVNTSGTSSITVGYDIMTIRNPYDGTSNTRINEETMQYRVGTSGSWTTLTGIEYQNNTTTQTTAVTTPQKLETKSVVLPTACDNQAIVQIRWVSRQVSGVGSRPSFAVDNISVTGTTSYVWNGATSDWTVATNWTPSRTTPAASDIIQFTGSATATNVPTQTIGKLALSGGAAVVLQAGTAGNFLSIGSTTGTALDVPLGCSLTTGSPGLQLSLGSGATGSIAGTLAVGATLTNSGSLTVNGTLQMNSGGSLAGTAPTYGGSSLLKYSSGGTFARGLEWSATSGAGYPANVQISGGTTLNLGANGGAAVTRAMSGSLTIDSGSKLGMNESGNEMTGNLIVPGNVTVPGTLELGTGSLSAEAGSIEVGGNFDFTGGTLLIGPSSRYCARATFNGTGTQIVSATGELGFPSIFIDKASGIVQLACDARINAWITTGLGMEHGDLDLNGHTLSVTRGEAYFRVNNGAHSILSSSGPGTVYFYTDGLGTHGDGSLVCGEGVTVICSYGIPALDAPLTINGVLESRHGGLFAAGGVPLYYGPNSLLRYRMDDLNLGAGMEWSHATGSGAPMNVQVTATPGHPGTLNLNSWSWQTETVPHGVRGNFTIDPGCKFIIGSALPVSVQGNVTVAGELDMVDLAVDGGLDVGGNWTLTGTFVSNGLEVRFNGTAPQTITGPTTFGGLTVNGAGVSLNDDIVVAQTLGFTSGNITTGGKKVSVPSTGTISHTSGHVVGNLEMGVATGSPVGKTFVIGDPSNYTPVDVAFGSVATAGSLTATTTTGDHPQLGSSIIVPTKSVNRYWTFTNSGVGFDNYAATFNFQPGDLDGAATPSKLVAGKYDGGSWSYPAVGTKTDTSTEATGLTSFSDFALGDPPTYSISASAGTGGTIDPEGEVVVDYDATQDFTIAANPCYDLDDVLVDGVPQGPITTYSFTNVTANHTIAASFTLRTYTITATAGTGGSIAPSGPQIVNCGASQGFTIMPAPNYTVLDVLVDGSSVGAVGTYTFTNVQADHTIDASFVFSGSGNTVDAGPASAVITLGNPTVTVPVRITRLSGTPKIMAFSVIFTVSGPISLPSGRLSITLPSDGGYLNANGGRTLNLQRLERSDLGPGIYEADGTTLGAPCGSDALSGTLFNVAVSSAELAGTGTITINSVTLRNCTNGDILADIGTVAPVLVDRSAPTVTVVSPNGGETWFVGETHDITWTGTDPEGVAGYALAYSTTGSDPYTVIATVAGTETSYPWSIPAPMTSTAKVRVSATDVHGNPGVDFSDANFKISVYHTITATAGTGGVIVPSGAVQVADGADRTFDITANPTYHILDVKVDDVSQGAISTYTFTDVIGDHTIAASFALDPVQNLDTGLTYLTIQAALDAAETLGGHTIHADGGVYEEQVVITKTVTIDGDGCGATIIKSPVILTQSFATPGIKKPVVFVNGVNATIQDLTVDGAGRGNANVTFIGIAFWNGGGTVSHVCVEDIEDTPFSGAQSGVGLYSYNNNSGPYALELDTVTVTDFQKNAMALSGEGMTVDVHDCTVTGKGYTAVTAQNGIQVGFGAGGAVTNCKISDIGYAGPGWSASGLLAYGPGGSLAVSGLNGVNRITNVQVPINWYDTNGSMTGIEVSGGSDWGPIFIYNSSTTGKASQLQRPLASPMEEEVLAKDGSRSTYTVSVNNSCLSGTDVAGTVGILAYTEGGGLAVTATGNEISDWDYGLGTWGVAATLTANLNSVTSNATAGYDNSTGGAAQNAENNWWGDADGPGQNGANPVVGGNVDFDPWLHVNLDENLGCGYQPVPHTITATAGPNGSIDPSGAVTVYEGGTQIFSMIPADHYHVADVLVDDVSQGALATYTFTNVTMDHTIEAVFAADPVKNLDTELTYLTIQAALDAAETLGGHTIHADAGVYEEQVVITKAVTIDGDGCGATIIKSPVTLTQSFTTSDVNKPVVFVNGVDATIQDLTVDGAGRGNTNYRFVGIGFWNGGGTVSHVCVEHVEDTPFGGGQHGVGVYTYNNTGGPYALELDTVTVTDFQKTGMALGGEGLTVNVHDCVTTGKGYTTVTAQNGIQVGYGAGGAVTNCKISEIGYTPATWTASGLLALYCGGTLTVSGLNGTDKITNVQSPISWYDTNGSMTGIEVSGGSDWGPIFVYNSTTGKASRLERPLASPMEETVPSKDGSRSAYAVSVSNSCLTGTDATGTVGIGAYTEGGDLTVTATGNEISDWDYGFTTYGSAVTLTACLNSITSNPSAGYDNTGSPTSQSAENNWWGDEDGPGQNGANPVVGGNVDFDPWLHVNLDEDLGCGYQPVPHTVTATAGPNGSIDPSGAVTVYEGGTQTFTMTPADCYQVADVLVDDVSQGPLATYTFNNVVADHTISVTFALRTYTITASAGTGGTIDPLGAVVVDCGADQDFTIAAGPCYDIADVLVDGVPQGPITTYSFTNVRATHTIAASFVLRTYTITASAGTGGTIDPNGAVVVNCGSSQGFTIAAIAGYHILDVIVDSASQGPLATYTFTNVTEPHTIAATFATDPVKNLNTGLTYLTIQPAIDAPQTQDTHVIQIDPGTYPGAILVDKELTLRGAQYDVDACSRSGAETVIDGLDNASGTIQVTASNVTLDGLKVVNSTFAIFATVPCSDLTVVNTIVDDASNGIMLYKATTGTVEHNKVSNCSVTGISGGDDVGNPTTATIAYNCVDHARYGISGYLAGSTLDHNAVTTYGDAPPCGGIAGQFVNTTITTNSVSGYVYGAGIGLGAYPDRPLASDVTISGNTISGNGAGIYLDADQTLVDVVAHNNDILTSLQYGVRNLSTATFDATCNWWGTTAGPDGTNDVSGSVTAAPWLNGSITGSPTCTLPLSTLTVNITGSGTVGLVPPGSTYDYGTSVQLTAYPAGGWHFVQWDGDASGTANPTTVVMNGDKTVTATFELNPPVTAITDLSATQVRTANPPGSTTQITLSWAATPSGTTVKVYRIGFGAYPEYDDAGGAPPAAPGAYPPAGWTEVTGVTAPGQNDLPTARDYYYYVAYVQDIYGTWSDPSNVTTGTLNYHLGDVTDGYAPGIGNNIVDTADISLLGARYGLSGGAVGPYNYLDVGPTTTSWIDGRPMTDNSINFEDLVVFAMNYELVSFVKTLEPIASGANELALEAPAEVSSGTVTARLLMHGTGSLLAVSARLSWDPAVVEPTGQVAGDWLKQQSGFLFKPEPGVLDAAVFGTQGMRGDGLFATITFRVLAAGDPKIVVESVDGRDLRNNKVDLSITIRPLALPTVTQLAAARPNPFHQTTTIAFSLATSGPVELAIYSVDGRRVRTLASDIRDPGEYSVEWDGRDDGGNAAAAGVYYAHLVSAQGRFTRAIAHLK